MLGAQHKGKELFHSLAACRNKAFAKVTPKPITVNVTFPEPGEADDELSLAVPPLRARRSRWTTFETALSRSTNAPALPRLATRLACTAICD